MYDATPHVCPTRQCCEEQAENNTFSAVPTQGTQIEADLRYTAKAVVHL